MFNAHNYKSTHLFLLQTEKAIITVEEVEVELGVVQECTAEDQHEGKGQPSPSPHLPQATAESLRI